MARLGTYSTFDCPTGDTTEAYLWLTKQFGEIGGRVRLVMNPHDLGEYPSFEIDYPATLDLDEEDDEDVTPKEEWEDRANEIETEYGKKFAENL